MSGRPGHIPDHWAWATVGDLTEFVTSGSRGWAKHYAEHGPLFLRVGNLDHDTVSIDLAQSVRVRPPAGAEGERTKLKPGDILLSITAEVGMVGLVSRDIGEAYVSQHVALVRPLAGTWPRGLAYTFLDPQGLQALARKAQYGATKPGLSLPQVRGFALGVPPYQEHERIVQNLESYISRLDDAVATLERAERHLKRYRASVLKAAVEGRLVPTEADLARADGRDYEPASVLLERTLAERQRRWEEAELARMRAKRQVPKDDRWKTKYREPAPPATADLPSLPEGWCWATVDQVCCDVRYGTSAKTDESLSDGVPVIRMGNLVDGSLDFGDLKYLAATHAEFPDLLLASGDLLFNRTNSAELVGKTAVFHTYLGPCSYASYLIRVRFSRGIEADWVAVYLNSAFGRQWVSSVVSQQVGQANVNGSKLRSCTIPLPPAGEQARIASEVDRLLSLAVAEAEAADTTLHRCDRLRQSILKWAFEGKLVEPDANDEPASVLLERIRAAKEQSVADKPVKRGSGLRSTR